MVSTIQTAECMGILIKFIVNQNGRYIYFQKASKLPNQWAKEVGKYLIKGGCSIDGAIEKCLKYKEYYFNKHYYKKPKEVAQMIFELGE